MEEHIQELKDAEKVYSDDAIVSGDGERQVKYNDGTSICTGFVLIGVGAFFLLYQVTGFYIQNWWALFIMIPALNNLSHAWKKYRRHGRLTHSARGALTGGLVLTMVTLVFLFQIDWTKIWPLFLIVGGLGAFLGGWLE